MSNKQFNLSRLFVSLLIIGVFLLALGLFKIIQSCEATKNSINVTFPTETFNQTESITNNIVSIPLLDNWQVTCNNTIQWAPTPNNPRVALGFFSSLAHPEDLSIQLIEYNNGSLDVDAHNPDHPNGDKLNKLQPLNWANPLTISLISGTLTVSSSAGSYVVSFPSFPLRYITGGSTESDICYGGKVNLR